MDKPEFHVRTALMPLFYRDFRCLAADCRNNCCGGWEIAFSKKDYLNVKRSAKSKELSDILSGGMSRIRDRAPQGLYAHFRVGNGGACAFLTEEGLCRLQLECGAEALPEICRMYPRRCSYTTAAKEFALTPTCEAVLALLWDLPQGIDFLEEDLPRQDWRVVTGVGGYAWFPQVRSLCIDVLQERSLSLSRRVLLLAMVLQRLAEMDWSAEGTGEAWLDWAAGQLQNPSTAAVLEDLPRDRREFLRWNTRVLMELYAITQAGTQAVYRSLASALSTDGEAWEERGLEQFTVNITRYRTLEEQLQELLGHSDNFFENLMVTAAFYLSYPSVDSPERLRQTCAELCRLYSFYRFSAVLSCHQEASRERLFEVIGRVSRELLHSVGTRKRLLGQDGSLAHMAILTGG